MGKSGDLRSTLKEPVLIGNRCFPCEKKKKINLSHHSSLYQDKGHLVVAFCIVWCFLGAIRHCWRGSFRVIGILYGKKNARFGK